jgi:DNA polymerase-3 subunit beta
MRFTIQREAFLKPLRIVSGVVERKHSLAAPILLNVLLCVNQQDFSLTTTDQEVELVAKGILETPVSETGAVTVPVRKLMDICKALPEGAILSFNEEEHRVILRSGRSRFMLSTLPADNFPHLDEMIGDFSFSTEKKHLKNLLDQVCFAMAEQDVRHYLNAMLLEVKNNHLYGVAADGHRLAFDKVTLSDQNLKNKRVLIPRKGVLELQRLLDDSDDAVTVVLGDNHLRATTNDVQLSTKLLDGRFPDYEKLINQGGNKIFMGRRESLKDCFQRAGALFNDRFRGVSLKLTNGCLKILAINTEQDEVEEDLNIEYTGDDLEIGFNVKYLIDFLNVIQTENVQFTFADSNSSARVEGIGETSGIYVIMPMKI